MILYHYCSNFAFHGIIESKAIWLSALSLANDRMEGKLAPSLIERMACEDGLGLSDLGELHDRLRFLESVADGLGFCLSEEGDLLSQWRGYADNGAGVTIGFSKDIIAEFPTVSRAAGEPWLRLQKVEYEHQKQEALLVPIYKEVKKLVDKGALTIPGRRGLLDGRSEEEIARDDAKIERASRGLLGPMLGLLGPMYLVKGDGFAEEKEWRLLSFLAKGRNDQCSFRPRGEQIVPYRVFSLSGFSNPPIAEVIAGPRNQTPSFVMEKFLAQAGYPEARVKRSSVTYR